MRFARPSLSGAVQAGPRAQHAASLRSAARPLPPRPVNSVPTRPASCTPGAELWSRDAAARTCAAGACSGGAPPLGGHSSCARPSAQATRARRVVRACATPRADDASGDPSAVPFSAADFSDFGFFFNREEETRVLWRMLTKKPKMITVLMGPPDTGRSVS